MRACIHRGAAEVGGNCLELEHDGNRIVLDVGRPLWAGHDDVVPLPEISGLATGDDPHLLGVILSHGHQDHWGLMPQVHPDVPRFIGKAAADILRAAQFWSTGIDLHETGHPHHREPFTVGRFTITPYLNDHSAFDAYSLLVEAGGERLFYTGDFRGHGRKAALFEELLADPPGGVDVLVCEGTSLRPDDSTVPAEPMRTEAQVEEDMAQTFRDTDGLAVVLASPQNIDRLVTTYRACLRAGRDLVVDLYGADIAAAAGRDTIPRPSPDWPRVHVYVPQRQRVRVKSSGEFHRVAAAKTQRIYAEDLAAEPSRYVLFGAYQSEIRRLLAPVGPHVGAVVWSLWDGYLTEPSGVTLRQLLEVAGVPFVHHHTSGHASADDLLRLASAMDPRQIVPIHTDAPELLVSSTRTCAKRCADRAWWSVHQGGLSAPPGSTPAEGNDPANALA